MTVMARIALWARLRQLTVEDVEQALVQKRSIIKTWSLRGALHLHRASDFSVVVGGLMPKRLLREQQWIHRAGLKEEETTRIVLNALNDGPLTRARLSDSLNKKLGAWTRNWRDGGWGVKKVGSSLAWHLVEPAMARGLVCFGPTDGQEVTFVRVDQWIPGSSRIPPENEAEEELVRRYLHAFGPGDAKDFRAWAGGYLRRIRAALERLTDELVEVDSDGHRGYLLKKDLPNLERADVDRGVVRLLPSFDPFMQGHHYRGHLVDQARYREVYKDAGWLAPVVLLDGRVAGTWSYHRRPGKLEVDVKMFSTFSKGTREKAEEEARDLSRFLETPDVAIRFRT